MLTHNLRTELGGHTHAREYGSWAIGFSHYPSVSTNGRMLINQARQKRQQMNYNSAADENNNPAIA